MAGGLVYEMFTMLRISRNDKSRTPYSFRYITYTIIGELKKDDVASTSTMTVTVKNPFHPPSDPRLRVHDKLLCHERNVAYSSEG